MNTPARILVIKLSALGDFVQAFGPFASIRAHHRRARITLLTTRPYVDMARRSPWFDDVWTDVRPRPLRLDRLWALRRMLRAGRFDRVYDLQTSRRSSAYYRLMGAVEWSGIARGCSHPHANPDRDAMHTIERQAEQLRLAGVKPRTPDADWLAGGAIERFGLPKRFALLIPGAAAHRPGKRWPAKSYGALAGMLAARGVTPVVLGAEGERRAAETICAACPQAVSLIGETSLFEVAALACKAAAAVGNDTGPSHLVAAAGTPTLTLYSAASDPALCAPRGPRADILRRLVLADLTPQEVMSRAGAFCGLDNRREAP